MVVKLRSAVGVAMIWLATVAGVSATAWVAIDRAGRDITGGRRQFAATGDHGRHLRRPPTNRAATPEPPDNGTSITEPHTSKTSAPAPNRP